MTVHSCFVRCNFVVQPNYFDLISILSIVDPTYNAEEWYVFEHVGLAFDRMNNIFIQVSLNAKWLVRVLYLIFHATICGVRILLFSIMITGWFLTSKLSCFLLRKLLNITKPFITTCYETMLLATHLCFPPKSCRKLESLSWIFKK
jgi:hypothetical protein